MSKTTSRPTIQNPAISVLGKLRLDAGFVAACVRPYAFRIQSNRCYFTLSMTLAKLCAPVAASAAVTATV
jgi:hypothetical protein